MANEITTPIKEIGSAIAIYGTWIVVGLVVLGIFTGIAIWAYKRKKWNLKAGIKIARSDGQIINHEEAKGNYNADEGYVKIKRKGIKATDSPPFNLTKYGQGKNYIEYLQLGPDDHLPIHPKSYTIITDEETGEKYALLDIYANIKGRKAFLDGWERTRKDRFTIKGFLDKHWRAIEMGILVFIILLGQAIIYMNLPGG
ncbi:MAG: hypothetical protein ACOCUD_01710 [Bacillota bacterium]